MVWLVDFSFLPFIILRVSMNLKEIYDSQYKTLLAQRERYVFLLSEINRQIIQLKAEAAKDQIALAD